VTHQLQLIEGQVPLCQNIGAYFTCTFCTLTEFSNEQSLLAMATPEEPCVHPSRTPGLPRRAACRAGLRARRARRRRSDQLRTMLPTYQELVAAKALRMLVFSGLYDGMEPHLGTELWLAKLNLTVAAPARPWFDPLVRAPAAMPPLPCWLASRWLPVPSRRALRPARARAHRVFYSLLRT